LRCVRLSRRFINAEAATSFVIALVTADLIYGNGVGLALGANAVSYYYSFNDRRLIAARPFCFFRQQGKTRRVRDRLYEYCHLLARLYGCSYQRWLSHLLIHVDRA
jgi:hypothetical protein